MMLMNSEDVATTEVAPTSKTEKFFRVVVFGLLGASLVFAGLKVAEVSLVEGISWWIGLSPLVVFMLSSIVVSAVQEEGKAFRKLSNVFWTVSVYGTIAFAILKGLGLAALATVPWWVAAIPIPVVLVIRLIAVKAGKKHQHPDHGILSPGY